MATSRMIISMTISRIDSGSVFGKATTFAIRFHANSEIASPFKDKNGQKLRILILDLAICCVKLNAKVVFGRCFYHGDRYVQDVPKMVIFEGLKLRHWKL